MWDKIGKMQGAIVLAVLGSGALIIFMIAMAIVAATHNKWDMADKWLTMLFTQATGVFFGFLFVKAQQATKPNQP